MLILDTSLLVAYANDRVTHHAAAHRLLSKIQGDSPVLLILHELVLVETAAVLLGRRGLDFSQPQLLDTDGVVLATSSPTSFDKDLAEHAPVVP